ESGIPKCGDKSAGVARQYCGATGKIDNCQVAVYLGYAGPGGHTLSDEQLYLPGTNKGDGDNINGELSPSPFSAVPFLCSGTNKGAGDNINGELSPPPFSAVPFLCS